MWSKGVLDYDSVFFFLGGGGGVSGQNIDNSCLSTRNT